MKGARYTAILMLGVAIAAGACSQTGSSNGNANAVNKAAANTNASTNANAASSPASTDPKAATAFSIATPTDTYKTAYDCRQRKDIECLKKVMSKDVQDFLVMMGKDDNKTLDDELRELCDRPQAPTNESRNETITGSTATIEYPDDKGEWHTMDFEKVDAGWQMSAPGGGPKPSDAKPKKP